MSISTNAIQFTEVPQGAIACEGDYLNFVSTGNLYIYAQDKLIITSHTLEINENNSINPAQLSDKTYLKDAAGTVLVDKGVWQIAGTGGNNPHKGDCLAIAVNVLDIKANEIQLANQEYTGAAKLSTFANLNDANNTAIITNGVFVAGGSFEDTGHILGGTASNNHTTAIGEGAQATKESATATGVAATAGERATATGYGANATNLQTTATGYLASATSLNSTATGYYAKAQSGYSTATGATSTATGSNATATGYGATAGKSKSTATGAGAQAMEELTTATGANTTANNIGATATGACTSAGYHATATGYNAQATYSNATAIGCKAAAAASNATAVGYNAQAQLSSTATGYGAQAAAMGSFAYGVYARTTRDGEGVWRVATKTFEYETDATSLKLVGAGSWMSTMSLGGACGLGYKEKEADWRYVKLKDIFDLAEKASELLALLNK